MISLQILPSFSAQVDTTLLEHAARKTLESQGVDAQSGLTIVIAGDEQLEQLNSQFRGVDSPTDVLSFPAGYVDPDSNTLYLGDVVISLPRATAQAQEAGHTLEDELQLLVVHGILHLLGHDHAEVVPKAHMWSVQAQILAELGCNATIH